MPSKPEIMHPDSWYDLFKKTLLWITLGLTILILSFFLTREDKDEMKDCLQAKNSWDNLISTSDDSEKAKIISEIEKILQKRPLIRPIFEPQLVQFQIQYGELNENLADHSLCRVQQVYPSNIIDYARTSILIEKQQYQQALVEAIKLKDTLLKDPHKTNTSLYGLNLFRIAEMEDLVGMDKENKQGWHQLAEYLNFSTSTSQSEQAIKNDLKWVEHFKLGNLTLLEYVRIKLSDS